jgi:WS/DGAT/MGAT family acyltransferase
MTQAELNHRLSMHDALFLYWERPTQPMHVGECLVYDGAITKDELIHILSDRMHLLPRYRQKVVFPPFALAHPTWEDDPDFDLQHHVEEMSIQAPGDDRVLSKVGGELFSQLLDRNHPLWKFTVLQGHESGNTILFLRLHHAMVDGVSSIDVMEVLHDSSPKAPPVPSTAPWQPQPLPNTLTVLKAAAHDQLSSAAKDFRMLRAAMRPSEIAKQVETLTKLAKGVRDTLSMFIKPAPKTPWNRPISTERQFAWLEVPFESIRDVRRGLGGTVNDVVLTILSGALGKYLERHGYPTEDVELRAMCPVSMRKADQHGDLGNLISLMIPSLFVGIKDPAERHSAQRHETQRLKDEDQAGSMHEIIQLARRVPPALHALGWGLESPGLPEPLNIVSTNVPGPQSPLYLAGRELLHWYPLGVPWTSLGLFLCTLSYNQKLVLGLVVDPKLVPDVWDTTEDLRASYSELLQASERAIAATATPPARKRRSRGTTGKVPKEITKSKSEKK